MTVRLTLAQARRMALAAQGLHRPRPSVQASTRTLVRTFERLQVVQIDSVNVLARSHYLPFFSRLGPYDRAALDRLSARSPRRMVEYWAHEASYVRPEHFEPLRAWQRRKWVGAHDLDPLERAGLAERILAVLATSRPLTAAALTGRLGHVEERRRDQWGWNWNAVQHVLGSLFEDGLVSSAGRTSSFERRYTLTSAIVPGASLPADGGAGYARDGGPDDGLRVLTRAAVGAHGIGTARCVADYFRLPVRPVEMVLRELVSTGEVEVVEVPGWGTLYKDSAAALPRSATGRALLSPFDSLVFERRRLEQLFGFKYRIEIYTPAERREYGYYVLPFLLRDVMAARVDLKADRVAGTLLVHAAHGEPDAPADTAVELAAELRLLADWLELDDVRVADRGNLAVPLRRAAPPRVGASGKGNQSAVPRVSPVD
ncbi:winged helix-turn-helix domain-containing protein [Sinomonas sp. P10A9]|uniref:Winged helix-turn-helix domain-containing protein n=1 Tax=Sinomonas puerhi TaxID=3238584 RepID=A0AB39KZC2_9MICC